jgi:vacuolar-type H+-ATPase subunit H
MAESTLQKVQAAESNAKYILDKAREDGVRAVADAKANAQRFIAAAKDEAVSIERAAAEAAGAAIEAGLAESAAKLAKEIERLQKSAEKNKNAAVSAVIKALV